MLRAKQKPMVVDVKLVSWPLGGGSPWPLVTLLLWFTTQLQSRCVDRAEGVIPDFPLVLWSITVLLGFSEKLTELIQITTTRCVTVWFNIFCFTFTSIDLECWWWSEMWCKRKGAVVSARSAWSVLDDHELTYILFDCLPPPPPRRSIIRA